LETGKDQAFPAFCRANAEKEPSAMPIPLIALGAGAVAAGGGGVMNLVSKNTEKKAKALLQTASETRSVLLAEWQKIGKSSARYVKAKKAYIEVTYTECRARSEPVFERYGHALGDTSEWPMPPGWEKIQAIKIPPAPGIKWTEWKNSEAYKKATNIKGGMQIVNNDIMKHDYANATTHAVRFGGFKFLGAALDRNTAASKFLTEVTAFAADNDQYAAEIEGLKKSIARMMSRANTLCQKLRGTKEFFDIYIIPCEKFLCDGRRRQDLSDKEWKQIKYLARVRVMLTDIARLPLM
jgi:hypothetical protein